MSSASTIIIFTKDRPQTLVKTLTALKSQKEAIIVLDDSYRLKNRKENARYIYNYTKATYHGKKDQSHILENIQIKNIELFINKLGVRKWNLGNIRNYALLLTSYLGVEKVLFIDDDIIVKDKTLISKTFELLDSHQFVGAKISATPDDSIVGHIVRKLGLPPEEFLSGGFLAFKNSSVTEYFLNIYNEDWLWLYLHNTKGRLLQYGKAEQLFFNTFKDAIKKGKNQEIGEILVDGVKESLEYRKTSLLLEKKFWVKILEEKQDYFRDLLRIGMMKKENKCCKILTRVASYSSTLDPGIFASIFRSYYKTKPKWVEILHSFKNN